MNRREFAKGLGAVLVVSQVSDQATAQTPAGGATPTLYYVDGYHGGSRGHMPAGSWRDILNAMRAIPEWKISLDIEPASWDDLRREDPQAYRELRGLLEDRAVNARVEMVNGTFSQPFGWANGGESTIRQLLRGRDKIHEHFPNAVIETYAVQEPCWASCLPQLLRSLGFNAAVLKNPGTAWGGYSASFDAETVALGGSRRHIDPCGAAVRLRGTGAHVGNGIRHRLGGVQPQVRRQRHPTPCGELLSGSRLGGAAQGHRRAYSVRHLAGVHAAGGGPAQKAVAL